MTHFTHSELADAFLIFTIVKSKGEQYIPTEDELFMLENLYMAAKDKYYKGEEIMSDPNFDDLEVILKRVKSKVVEVVDGDTTVAERHQHFTPMLSLDKEQILDYDFKDTKTVAALGNIDKFLNKYQNPELFEATAKYDGNAISLQYINGVLNKALTRGNEEHGGGIDRIDKMQYLVPEYIDIKGTVEIRGEVVINKELWKKKYSDPNKIDNPRNYVAGVLGRDDIDMEVIEDLQFVAYQIIYDANTNPRQREDTFQVLHDNKFNKKYDPLVIKFNSFDSFKEIFNRFKRYRENECPFQIDGIVLKYPESMRHHIGETSHHPKWALAIKFPPQRVITTIIGIWWKVGTTGQVTPIALLEPVELDGTEVKRASLHNYGYIIRKNATIGATVEIAKKGDIIPQVIDVIEPGEGGIKAPTHCECGAELHVVDGKSEGVQHLICENPNCKVQVIGKLEKAVKILKIERIGEAHAEKLYNAGIRSIIDLFDKDKFNKERLIESEQYKEGRELDIILNSIELIKKVKIEHLINSLNFENVGTSTSLQIARLVSGLKPDWAGLQESVEHIFTNQDSDDNKLIRSFISVLEKRGVEIEYVKDVVIEEGTKIYEMTGSPKPHFKTKAEFTEFAKKHNLVHGKLNKDADYLITDSYSSSSSKMVKAKKLGVEIITYEDLLQKFN